MKEVATCTYRNIDQHTTSIRNVWQRTPPIYLLREISGRKLAGHTAWRSPDQPNKVGATADRTAGTNTQNTTDPGPPRSAFSGRAYHHTIVCKCGRIQQNTKDVVPVLPDVSNLQWQWQTGLVNEFSGLQKDWRSEIAAVSITKPGLASGLLRSSCNRNANKSHIKLLSIVGMSRTMY
jgi:hypothetical protein